MAKVPDFTCSIERTLGVLGERWTFLILREAFLGATRFVEFRDRLGVAPDVLTDRLGTLVDYGVLEREPYREPGARSRFAYRLTPSGRELQVVLAALQQWGDEHLPRPRGAEHAAPGRRDRPPRPRRLHRPRRPGGLPRRVRDGPRATVARRKRAVRPQRGTQGPFGINALNLFGKKLSSENGRDAGKNDTFPEITAIPAVAAGDFIPLGCASADTRWQRLYGAL